MRHHQLIVNKNNNTMQTMESLKLPAELFWDGKSEPTTPPTSDLFSVVDCHMPENWLDEDNILNDNINNDEEAEELKTKLALDNAYELLNGDELVVDLYNLKDEHWNYAKPQTPTIANYIDDYLIENTDAQPNILTKVCFPNGIEQLNGLCGTTSVGVEEIYATIANNFETAILTQLTPPHSPIVQNSAIINNNEHYTPAANNLNSTLILQTPETQAQHADIILLPHQTEPPQQQQPQEIINWQHCNTNDIANIATTSQTIVTDNEIQTQMVDEIVNSRAQELLDWHDELESISCSSSSFGSSYQADESITDEDWLPNSDSNIDTSLSSASSSPQHSSTEHTHKSIAEKLASPLKKRRAYGRDVNDRKLRKKEQNKNAATRYRQKKKLEMECVLSEEQELLTHNEELKLVLLERKREAKYLKTLIREFHHKQQELKKNTKLN